MIQNRYQTEEKAYASAKTVISIILISALFVSLCVGRYHISPAEVLRFMIGKPISGISYSVIIDLRIPRALLAMLIGASLAVSGTVYQGIFNNRMASPDLLGVSSGCSVGACIGILCGFSEIQIMILAFISGLITVSVSVSLSRVLGHSDNVSLLLSGIAVGGLMSSLIGLTKYLADDDQKLSEITYWLLGSLAASKIRDVKIVFPLALIGMTICILFADRIDVLSLGKKEAKSLGIEYSKTMNFLIIIATLMTALSVSVSGTIGWVGLSVPNIIRIMFGNRHRKVLTLSMLTGSVFLIISDMMARTLAPNEIPLSVITGLLGTPIFLIALIKGRGGSKG